ncbi:MAG: electron transfer flavoprotein subunit alpha/FixB family protein [Acidimicrobiaceae bacterium]|nr:electron transfer flavoprotein subunit alpha/FixB family protein [Acidimicrobiaceae bacterium]
MLLVVLEHDRGTLGEAGREALTFGRTLAAKMGAEMHAAVIGAGAPEAAGPDAIAAEAGDHGAVRVYTVDDGVLSDFGPEAWGESIARVTGLLAPDAVLACGSERGNEVIAQAAVRLDAPMVANCTDITPPGGDGAEWSMIRVQWGGSLLEDATLSTAGPALLTCALHTVASSPVKPPPSAPPPVEAIDVDLPPELARTVVKERVVLEAGVTLPTAPVVVGGGRGVGSAEGFAPLEELAELLGGRVGCSRAVTNNGWRPHSDQVGQTGTRIAPEIYFASGISGAIQHWVGAMGSKHILAVNIDPEANMVVKADWAVIGDLHQVIPAISAEIRRRWS